MLLIPISDINPRERFPLINYLLIAANIAVFVLTVKLPGEFYQRWALVPADARPLAFITSMFLHAGLAHLGANMLFLWVAGDNIEDRCGKGLYLAFYLGAGIVAGAVHVLTVTQAGASIPTVGASGAISGVLGAYVILFPWARIRCFYWVIVVAGLVTLPSWVFIGIWFGFQLLAVTAIEQEGVGGVAYWAHIGGFAFGVGAMMLFRVLGLVRPGRRAPASGSDELLS